MKKQPEQFEPNEQVIQQAPKTLVPHVLAQLGLEGKHKSANLPLKSLRENLQTEQWQTRLAALETLDRQDIHVPIDLLLTALHDEDASVRAVAVRILGKTDDTIVLTKLEAALHDPDWHVRETAVFALGQHISPPIHLLTLAQNDEDSAVQQAATSMLRDIQTESFTVEPLPNSNIRQTHLYPQFSKFFDYKNVESAQHDKGKQSPLLRVFEVCVAAIVVLGLIGSWFALTRGVHTSTVARTGTTSSNKGSVLYHQDEMTPAVYWTKNSKYVYIHDKQDKVLHFINVETKQVTTITHPDIVAQTTTGKLATLTPDGLSVCTVDNTGSVLHIQIQSVLTNKVSFDASYPKIANTGTGIISQWSNDGTRIALSSDNGIITIANVTSVQPLMVLKGIRTPAKTLEWSQDDRQLLATTADGVMQSWNTFTGQRLFVVTVRSDTISPYLQAFSPNGKHVAIVPNDQSVQILDATTGKVVLTYHDVMSSQNAYYRWINNTGVISINEMGTLNTLRLQIWDVVTGRVALDMPLSPNSGYTLSLKNTYLVVQAPDATTSQVWGIATSRKIAVHTSSSNYMPFSSSPNEKYFITTAGGEDNKIDMWSATTGKTVMLYHSSDNSVVSAQWSPDGKYLLSLSTDGRTNPVGATLDLWQTSG